MPTCSHAAALANVDVAGGVLAHKHDRQAGYGGIVLDEVDDLFGNLRSDLPGQRLSIKNGCRHMRSSMQGDRPHPFGSPEYSRRNVTGGGGRQLPRATAVLAAAGRKDAEPNQQVQRPAREDTGHPIVGHHAEPRRQMLQLPRRWRFDDVQEAV